MRTYSRGTELGSIQIYLWPGQVKHQQAAERRGEKRKAAKRV